jgi:hypothetical protein
VNVLGDAHAPEDNRAFCFGVDTGDLTDGLGGNVADGPYLLRREVLYVFLKLLEAARALGDKLVVS